MEQEVEQLKTLIGDLFAKIEVTCEVKLIQPRVLPDFNTYYGVILSF